MDQKIILKVYNLNDGIVLNKQISTYRQDGNELSVSITEKAYIDVPMEINKLFKIEILLDSTNLIPNKTVLYRSYRFSVGDLEQKIGEQEDQSPIINKVITVMENSLIFSFV